MSTVVFGCNQVSKDKDYPTIMQEKNITLDLFDDCEDALDDSLHESAIGYIDSSVITPTSLIAYFKVKETCCKEFLGDYRIENDTLFFEFEQVNNQACPCLCWYRYKLDIKEIKEEYKGFVIRERFQ